LPIARFTVAMRRLRCHLALLARIFRATSRLEVAM
jgi:hypothetical protein